MSFRNVYFDKRKNKIHLWHTIKGERFSDTIDWVPYLFVDSKEKNTSIKSPTGKPVQKKTFKNYYEYKEFSEANKGIIYENNLKEEIQFLVDTYYKIPDDELEIPELKIIFFDAEMDSYDGSFPLAEEGKDPIVLICSYNSFSNEMHGWGIKPYMGKNKKLIYHHCESPQRVLESFIDYIHKEAPDILTGWNISGFDLPYFYNFSKLYLKEGIFDKLSPINKTSVWMRGEKLNIDIVGTSIIDYLPLFKQFYREKLAKYGLDNVAKHLFKKGKMDYSEHKNLHELFEKDWNKGVDYCVVDVWRVKQINDKCKFINLIQVLSILTKCPMKYYEQVTSLIEGVFLTYYRRNNKCAHRFVGGIKEDFPAALVKKPVLGMSKWIVSVDIKSSYPHVMMALNMGNNSYYGKIKTIEFDAEHILETNITSKNDINILTEYDVVNCTKNKKFPPFYLDCGNGYKEIKEKNLDIFNNAVKEKKIAIAPNGAIFKNNVKGTISEIEKYLFNKRDETNKILKEAKKRKDENMISVLDCKQNAIKTILNSIYGAISVPFFREYNINIATAITAGGRFNLIYGWKYVDEFFAKKETMEKCIEIFKKFK